MKMIVTILVFCLLNLCVVNSGDKKYFDNYDANIKTYQLDVPGKEPITIIEDKSSGDFQDNLDLTEVTLRKDDTEMKNLMTHIIHDIASDKPRCYGPSCQEGFVANEGPQGDIEEDILNEDKLKDFNEFPDERLQAIAALAAKIKKQKLKPDRYPFTSQEEDEDDKVYSSWNRVKVKQHKHPFDDKDGWVTLEPVAWSTSKISKWKPNVKKQKPTTTPNYWNDEESDNFSEEDRYPASQDIGNTYAYPQKKPILTRPGYINNKLHIPGDYEAELPSRPSWATNKPQGSMQQSMHNMQKPTHNSQQSMHNMQQAMHNLQSSWTSDDSRNPYRPSCDKDTSYGDDSAYYAMSDAVVTDSRPTNFPYDYEALHQSSQKRPSRRPTQVIYSSTSDMDGDRSRPPHGDGQWVLLSTTKGYKNKKRHRSLNAPEEKMDVPTIVSHQAVSLTVLPVDDLHTNMTTSHGGMLEVEKSFQTVEESKRDMDLKNDLEMAASQNRPVRHKIFNKKIVGNSLKPDSSTVLAAVGAGMVPATMAMVVPMMLGRRRRRDVYDEAQEHIHSFLNRIQ